MITFTTLCLTCRNREGFSFLNIHVLSTVANEKTAPDFPPVSFTNAAELRRMLCFAKMLL